MKEIFKQLIVLASAVVLASCVDTTRTETTSDDLPGSSADNGQGDSAQPDPGPARDTAECVGAEQGCADDKTVQVCNNGSWVPMTCGTNQACDRGVCVDLFGQAECSEIVACVNQCPRDEESGGGLSCADVCRLAGTAAEQDDYDNLIECLCVKQCGICGGIQYPDLKTAPPEEVVEQVIAYFECVEKGCAELASICYYNGAGSKTCAEQATCLGQCSGESDLCYTACIAEAEATQQLWLTALLVCLEVACGDEPPGVARITCGTQQMNNQDAACHPLVEQCVGHDINPLPDGGGGR